MASHELLRRSCPSGGFQARPGEGRAGVARAGAAGLPSGTFHTAPCVPERLSSASRVGTTSLRPRSGRTSLTDAGVAGGTWSRAEGALARGGAGKGLSEAQRSPMGPPPPRAERWHHVGVTRVLPGVLLMQERLSLIPEAELGASEGVGVAPASLGTEKDAADGAAPGRGAQSHRGQWTSPSLSLSSGVAAGGPFTHLCWADRCLPHGHGG